MRASMESFGQVLHFAVATAEVVAADLAIKRQRRRAIAGAVGEEAAAAFDAQPAEPCLPGVNDRGVRHGHMRADGHERAEHAFRLQPIGSAIVQRNHGLECTPHRCAELAELFRCRIHPPGKGAIERHMRRQMHAAREAALHGLRETREARHRRIEMDGDHAGINRLPDRQPPAPQRKVMLARLRMRTRPVVAQALQCAGFTKPQRTGRHRAALLATQARHHAAHGFEGASEAGIGHRRRKPRARPRRRSRPVPGQTPA